MAEFKNLTSQIEVISSPFNDSISYYNKSSSDNIVQLGVSAIDGDVVLSTVNANGDTIAELERFDFAEVINPALSSIELLVEQINTWIHDEPIKKAIDSIFPSVAGNPDGLRVSNNYDFNPLGCTVAVNDPDLSHIIYVFNESKGKVLYIKGSEQYTGSILENVLTFHRSVQSMRSLDIIYIIYQSKDIDKQENALLKMLDQVTELTQQQKITNQILTESTEVDIFKDKIEL